MARGKRSAALFEVINPGRPAPLMRGSRMPSFGAPSSWFRKNQSIGLGDIVAPVSQSIESQPREPDSEPPRGSRAARIFRDLDDIPTSLADPTLGPPPTSPLIGTPRVEVAKNESPIIEKNLAATSDVQPDSPEIDADDNRIVESKPIESRLIDSPPNSSVFGIQSQTSESVVPSDVAVAIDSRASGVDVAVDPQRQQITFKISYTSAIIVAFATIVALTLAYLIGQKMSRGPALAVAAMTTDQLRAHVAHPDVLDVIAGTKTSSNAIVQREGDEGSVSKTKDAADESGSEKTVTHPANNSVVAPVNPARQVNLNYVIAQSYPDQKSANDARDLLLKSGIGCTVEQGLRGLRTDWFTVVGTQGFARISSDEYHEYVRTLEKISPQPAAGKRSFKAFQPLPYKWDRPANSTAANG